MYSPNQSTSSRKWYKNNLKAEYSWFESRAFLLLDWMPYQKLKETICPIIYPYIETEGSFLTGIDAEGKKVLCPKF